MSFGVFQFRRGTPAIWSSVNPILADGELGLEKDTGLFKVGNGVDPWNSLPYGGIKGDSGTDATVAVGSVSTGVAGSNAAVSNVGTPQNAILNFVIPRGDTGATGNKGWSPVLAIVSDGERRVLQLTDWTGGEGSKPATGQFIGSTGFVATAASAIDIRGPQGQAGITPTQNTFASVSVGTSPTPTILTADNATDVLMVNAGAGISLTADAAADAFTITNTDTGSSARTAHEAAADPHPQYTTAAEAAAAAPVQSVNGQTGAVVVVAGTNNKSATRTAATASASTVVTSLVSLPIDAGEIQPGSEYEFFASLRIINTTTAANSVVTVKVGATNVLVLTQANGTTAAAAPGAPVQIYGRITFYSATQAEAIIHFVRSTAVAANIVLNTSAPVTVAAAEATTIDLHFNTSGTTSTFICRQASIQKVK